MTLLSLQQIRKSFGQNNVINDLSLTVKKGEFVSIIGPSGSGKSTIFNMIGGLLTPDDGIISMNGQKINGKRGSISYMPQSPSLLPWRTILDNVVLGQELQGNVDKEKAAEMLTKAGLGTYIHSLPHELSGGMKQRTAFIRALLSPQPIILLDEPFSALDELTRAEMQRWLIDIWEQHQPTILFVTHNIEEALYLSDKIVILSNRPASIKGSYHVPFPRPRQGDIMLDSDFLQCKKDIYRALTE
ncbi:ABC transporter ATP-binding protein [Cytobacillus horneckiae]|uniref:ABC transporter ATP-binding protein n=1 Tax=Cytobacillus horneckiae TaxID=549687 RepID=A0A2N0Z8T7_9BACI|nr:ABC transporter ATP-binding protein [Cytobacillus horneckiae]MEC1156762.1 ABC transporter ATP-binding protein [Cytobacillus horneckiae]MED2940522.1 ABC transporter ATP-binding protein [Cytobacillus horneckiae]PKG25924.1 ABC transporter ATP-binding protein [Cytobacillus horneckiae]